MIYLGGIVLGVAAFGLQDIAATVGASKSLQPTTTVMFYMNGDNDLTDEVLSAVDRIETVGSSNNLNIVALVDGHPNGIARFGPDWIGTHLLHITADHQAAQINSEVLADWGEQDLGDPDTLTRFIRTAIQRFPAHRYIFCAFAHGKGVIDTGNLTGQTNGKSLCISPDETSQTIMPLAPFKNALKSGLNGRKFTLMVLFSCLSSMLEIACTLSDVTDYMIASEDEIRLLNDPPGSHQLVGITFEGMLLHLQQHPSISADELGQLMVDQYILPYTQPVYHTGPDGQRFKYRYPASLALVDNRSIGPLVAAMDTLAERLIRDLNRPQTVLSTLISIQTALEKSQTFKSFLNLEYYDLLNWLNELAHATDSAEVRRLCHYCVNLLKAEVIRYERHTPDVEANGMAIYFNHYLLPENVYLAHQAMYRRTQFSQMTRWDELIDLHRIRMRRHRVELLMHQCRLAYRHRDKETVQRLAHKLQRIVIRQIHADRFEDAHKLANLLDTLPADTFSAAFLEILNSKIDTSSGTE